MMDLCTGKRIALFACFIYFFSEQGLLSQNQSDSLLTALNQASNDSTRISLLSQIARKIAKNHPDSAIKFARQGIALAEKSGFEKLRAECLNSIGIASWIKGDYPATIQSFLKALEIREKIGDKIQISASLNNLAIFYETVKKDYPMALSLYHESLSLDSSLNNQSGYARTLYNISQVYLELGQADIALATSLQSLAISKKRQDQSNISMNYSGIGHIYFYKKDYQKAMHCYRRALAILEKLDDYEGICDCLIEIGKTYSELSQYRQSIDAFIKALPFAKKMNSLNYQQLVFDGLYKTYRKAGDYKQAFKYLELDRNYYDSLFTLAKLSEIEQLASKFELQAKEKEIRLLEKEQILDNKLALRHRVIIIMMGLIIISALSILIILFRSYRNKQAVNKLLEQQKSEIESKNQQLSELNAARDKFFSVVAHDMRNPFSALIGFNALLISSLEQKEFEKAVSYADQINKISNSAFRLLENLLEWYMLQSNRIEYNPKVLLLQELITLAINDSMTLAESKNIHMRQEITPGLKVFADKYMTQAILRNLISNAIKYSYPDGEVLISAIPGKEIAEVRVIDHGIGMKPEDIAQLFRLDTHLSTPGTANERGTGWGLILCREFVEKIGGSIRTESESGKGSQFIFTLPVSNDQKSQQ